MRYLYELFERGVICPGMVLESRQSREWSRYLVLENRDDFHLHWMVACLVTGRVLHFSRIPLGEILVFEGTDPNARESLRVSHDYPRREREYEGRRSCAPWGAG